MNQRFYSVLTSAFLCISVSLSSFGQWTTEDYVLKSGWNAVYFHVDASHMSLNESIGADEGNPIEEIWVWSPAAPGSPLSFYDAPQSPDESGTEWLRWKRDQVFPPSTLQRLAGNVAALVRVREDVADYTWTVRGLAVPPVQSWTGSGMNFIGFPTPQANPPTWGKFLGPARSLHNHAEIYRYVGGPFSASNPMRLFSAVLRTTPLVRNEAYWVRAEEYNRYFGPFEIVLQAPSGIRFGETSGQYRIRLRNRIDESVTIPAHLLASEAPPADQEPIAGGVPLLRRGEIDLSDLTYGFARFSEGPSEWTLAPKGEPGSEVEIVLGLDRAAMAGNPGDLFASILRLSDAGGMTVIDLPVSARIAATDGLWVGNAVVNEVAHYLIDYEARAEDGERVLNPDGSYAIESINESFGSVLRPFQLRLFVHNGTGGTRLLQRVYHGTGHSGEAVLSLKEEALDPALLNEARRISVAHLPWSDGNKSWPFDGTLAEGAVITVSVPLDYDDQATNPFLHTYHPDHDNLDARFENELPQGAESYGITREITLRVQPPGGDFSSVTSGGGTLAGVYEENIILHGGHGSGGPASRVFRTRGGFALNRVSDIGTLIE